MVSAASVRSMVSSKGWVIPGIPASPKNSAQTDQPSAARVPMEMRVSMVAMPCRAALAAPRWNCQPPQMTAGAPRVRESHCQFSNCQAGTIAMATTGTASAMVTSSRCRNAASAGSGSASASSATGSGGAGSAAVYPVASTVATRSSTVTPPPWRTRAFSVAKLTVAATPSMRLSRFSIRAAQEAHVIPPISSSTSA
jgi:hypothetical protein